LAVEGDGKKLKDRILKKAKKKYGLVLILHARHSFLSTLALTNIWQALVRPILEYAAEVWGEGNWEKAEILQREMGRNLLGHVGNSANESVLGDLGWVNMEDRRDKLRLKFWYKILKMNSSRIPRRIYEADNWENNPRSWNKGTQTVLEKLGLEEFWKNQMIELTLEEWTGLVEKKILKRRKEIWDQSRKGKSSLNLYNSIKTTWGRENYLDYLDPKGVEIMAQMRSSYGFLKENTERHKKGDFNKICSLCYKGEDTVEHTLIHCNMYTKERGDLRASLKLNNTDRNLLLKTLLGKDLKKKWSMTISNFLKRIRAKRERIVNWGG